MVFFFIIIITVIFVIVIVIIIRFLMFFLLLCSFNLFSSNLNRCVVLTKNTYSRNYLIHTFGLFVNTNYCVKLKFVFKYGCFELCLERLPRLLSIRSVLLITVAVALSIIYIQYIYTYLYIHIYTHI